MCSSFTKLILVNIIIIIIIIIIKINITKGWRRIYI